eukprot:TRINITY_DN52_c0_g1_i1.p1 TRINITY_DN52_c0_g1~~TRINITY_DN52_c0_g1_i1.p1  ORF type:complete len:606 (+),score=105.15 TRINITY_DN52_c0_g1_i1:333-2150(+)
MPLFKKGGDQGGFIVGSDRWLGSRNPSSSTAASQSQGESLQQVTEEGGSGITKGEGQGEAPGVVKSPADTGLKGNSGATPPSRPPPAQGYYPVVYTGLPDTSSVEEAEIAGNGSVGGNPAEMVSQTAEVEAHEEVLVNIPGAIVHLIDEEESMHLATGEFQLVRLIQEGSGIAVFVRVGPELQWPLFKDECAVKLDPTHYFFSLKVPSEVLDAGDDVERQPSDSSLQEGVRRGSRREGSGDVRKQLESEAASSPQLREQLRKSSAQLEPGLETLNYGVTFSQPGVEGGLKELDTHLARYSLYTAPTVVAKDSAAGVGPPKKVDGSQGTPYTEGKPYLPPTFKDVDTVRLDKIAGSSSPKPTVPAKIVKPGVLSGNGQPLTEPNAAVYWTSLAPNVAEYSSYPAKAIAQGSGQIIRGLFWVSQATVTNLERGGAYMLEQGWIKPRTKGPMDISPTTRKNMKRVKAMSKMTSKVAKGVLTGVITTTGVFTGAVVNSKTGSKFFKLLPGEVALVSLDAFGKVFDAVEHTGKAVLRTSSSVTTGLVSHRYGPELAEVTEDGLKTTGHLITTAWTVSKIRKAFNPKGLTKTGISKSVLKAVVVNQKTPAA